MLGGDGRARDGARAICDFGTKKLAIPRGAEILRKPKKRELRRSLDYISVIRESYAVEKSSIDPRVDFKASMVEMIVEKQIFATEIWRGRYSVSCL
ncbi:hypothetical protein ACS0TY_032849 [Phlomoides rotata]